MLSHQPPNVAGAARVTVFEVDSALTATLAEASIVGIKPDSDDAAITTRRKRRTAMISTVLGVFSIHADTCVDAGDRAGLERLLRYGGRPPLSHRRLFLTATGKVCYRLRKPYYTGQNEIVLEPVAFLRRLAALVPPARQNQLRYYGLLAAQARDRDRLLALVPAHDCSAPDVGGDVTTDFPSTDVRRIRWDKLLARVFLHQVLICPHCRDRRTIIAAITDLAAAATVLSHLDIPTDLPVLARARPPPQPDLADVLVRIPD